MKPHQTFDGTTIPEARALRMHVSFIDAFSFVLNPAVIDDDESVRELLASDLQVLYDAVGAEDPSDTEALCRLSVETRAASAEAIPTMFTVHANGIFSVARELSAGERHRLLHTTAPELLYQSIREYLSFTLSKSAAGPVVLPALDFESLGGRGRGAADRKADPGTGGLGLVTRQEGERRRKRRG